MHDHHDTEVLMFGFCHYCGGTEYASETPRRSPRVEFIGKHGIRYARNRAAA